MNLRQTQRALARLQQTRAQRQKRQQPIDRTQRRLEEKEAAVAAWQEQRRIVEPTIDYPEHLPVAGAAPTIRHALAEHQVVIVTGETGSGKTTQLPKMLWEIGAGRTGVIACTQPRRLAAVSVAARLRDELQLDEPVATHAVRFDDRSAPETVWCVCTDGWLLAGAASDPDFESCDAIIVDEAHERSVTVDALLGLLRQALQRRPDLKVVVTSATLNAERFAEYFAEVNGGEPAPVIAVGGRQFPVDISYESPADQELSYQQAVVAVLRREHEARVDDGDFLCFLPSEADILTVRRRLRDLPGAVVLPLYARLSPGEQRRVFTPARGRKIILATNVAETSLTVPNITLVVDTGLARVKRYQVQARLERLPIEAIAQANAAQRAGRAGRVRPGRCIRLYDEADFSGREASLPPEIRRANLAGLYLDWLARNQGDPRDFPWIDPPTPAAWQQAALQLREIGAVRATGDLQLTPLGRQLAHLPADPALARLLAAGVERGVAHEAATLAALLSAQDPRLRPAGQEAAADKAHRIFWHESGDIGWALRLWQAYTQAGGSSARQRFAQAHFLSPRKMREWADTRHQLWSTLRQLPWGRELPGNGHDIDKMDLAAVHRCLVEAMPANVLCWDSEENIYRGTVGKPVQLHPGSQLACTATGGRRKGRPAWILATDIIETSQVFARGCVPVEADWLAVAIGDLAKTRYTDVAFMPKRQQVSAQVIKSWRGLTLPVRRRVDYGRIEPREATAIFVQQALIDGQLHPAPAVVQSLRRNVAEASTVVDRMRDGTLRLVESDVADHVVRVLLTSTDDSDHSDSIKPVSSGRTFQAWCRENDEQRLVPTPADLLGHDIWQEVEEKWPTRITTKNDVIPVRYRYDPDHRHDGITVVMTAEQAQEYGDCAWSLPGARVQLLEQSLVALPRAALAPIKKLGARKLIRRVLEQLHDVDSDDFVAEAWRLLQEAVGFVPVRQAMPLWVWPRYVVHDGREEILESRDGAALRLLRPAGLDWSTASTSWPAEKTTNDFVVAGPVNRYGRKYQRRRFQLIDAGIGMQAEARAFAIADQTARLDAYETDGAVGGLATGVWWRSWLLAEGRSAHDQALPDASGVLSRLQAWFGHIRAAWQSPDQLLRRGVGDLRAAAVQRTVAADMQRWVQASWLGLASAQWFARLPVFLQAAAARLKAESTTLQPWLAQQQQAADALEALLTCDRPVMLLAGLALDFEQLVSSYDEAVLAALPTSVRRDLPLAKGARAVPTVWAQRAHAFIQDVHKAEQRWRQCRRQLQAISEFGGVPAVQASQLLNEPQAVADILELEERTAALVAHTKQ